MTGTVVQRDWPSPSLPACPGPGPTPFWEGGLPSRFRSWTISDCDDERRPRRLGQGDPAPEPPHPSVRPLALVTGVGRTVGIGAGIAPRLAASGWDIAFTYWTPYDERMPWGRRVRRDRAIDRRPQEHGAATAAIEADLADPDTPARVFDEVERRLGPSPRW